MMAGIWCLAMALAAAEEPAVVEKQSLDQLAVIKRVYVDRFTGGETAALMREAIMSALQNTRLFVVTENPERADVTLRGAGEDLVYTETHSSSESLHARSYVGRQSSSEATLPAAGVSIGDSESSRMQERRHEATASVRLVNRDGDLIWSTTQESRGGKFLSASSDVADKITRQLKQDVLRARASAAIPPRQ